MSRRRGLVAVLSLSAAVAFAAAGCGGSGKKAAPAPAEQRVSRTGYTFAAPSGWTVAETPRGVTVTGPGSQLLSVAVYRLVKPYAPARFAAAARELDGVASRLAAGKQGRLATRATVTISGRKARAYGIAYDLGGRHLVQTVGFLLRGRTEWLLVCRREASDPDTPCLRFLSSFAVKAGG